MLVSFQADLFCAANHLDSNQEFSQLFAGSHRQTISLSKILLGSKSHRVSRRMKNVLLVLLLAAVCLHLGQATIIQASTSFQASTTPNAQATDLRNVREMYFYNGRMTTGNRPQYVCRNVNGENYCNQYRANTIRCVNVMYMSGVRWRCENYQDSMIPSHLYISNERVVCDRYVDRHPYSGIDYVVDGSCHLEYSYSRRN